MSNAQEKTLVKGSLGFFSGTALSRVSGFVREASMAFCFGASASIGAFVVALRLSILLRRIFGEGALLNGFVPHFEEQRQIAPLKAAQFFRDTFFSLLLLLLLLVGVIEGGLYFSLFHCTLSPENRELLSFMALIFPGVIFICLFGICSALLHCERNFFLSGVSPIAYNCIWIVAIWKLRGEAASTAATGLSLAVSVAFFAQWLFVFPKAFGFLRRHLSWREIFQCKLFPIEMRRMLSSLSLGVLGVGAAQINSAIDAIFARVAALEGPAYLNYAIHLQQLPLALVGISIASALLPICTRAMQAGDIAGAGQLLERSIVKAMWVILPASVAIFALGAVSVNLVYGRGDFSQSATGHTTWCLWGYGLGLIPMVLAILFSPAFYAKRDYWTPTLCSLASIAMNVLCNALCVCVLQLGPESLAFSTSIASAFNAWLLYRQLSVKTGISFSPSLLRSVLKIAVAALCAGAITLIVSHLWLADPSLDLFFHATAVWKREFTAQFSDFLLLFGVFSLIFLSAAWTLEDTEHDPKIGF